MAETQLIFFPSTPDRADAIAAGFRFGHIGTHTSRTIMVSDLTTVFAAVPANSDRGDYASEIIERNCLGKPTVSTRRLSNQRLGELYGFDPTLPVFRIIRRLWKIQAPGHGLLALLVALARDPLLMSTASVIVSLPEGAEFQRRQVKAALEEAVGDRFNEATLNKVVRNAASSWSQSGHLEGRTFKFRRLVRATPGALALSLYLANAAGLRGSNLLTSGWVRVLDCSLSAAKEVALEAKRLGLIDLRMAGDVVEFGLGRLDPAVGRSGYGAH